MKPGHLRGTWIGLIGAALIGAGFPGRGAAWGTSDQIGTSAAVWMAQPSSPRSLGMGGAGTGDTDGVQTWWHNPAALAGCPDINAELSWMRHWTGAENGGLSLGVPTAWGTAGAGLTYIQSERMEAFDEAGLTTGAFSVSDLAVKLGWAYRLDPLLLGVAGTYFREDYSYGQTQGLALDAGMVWRLAPDLDLGLAGLHLGVSDQGDLLPAELRAGASWRALPTLQVVADLVYPRDTQPYFNVGTAWHPWDLLSLSLGWCSGPMDRAGLGGMTGLTAGAGLRFRNFSLNYAFTPAEVLGNVHRLGLVYRPDAASDAPEKSASTEPALVPRQLLLPQAGEKHIVFTPKPLAPSLKVRSMEFKVLDEHGQIVRVFSFAGNAVPKEWAWDGKDQDGRNVDPQRVLTYEFTYQTDQGVKTELQTWPRPLTVYKLRVPSLPEGLESRSIFRFEGDRAQVRSWRLQIRNEGTQAVIRDLEGIGPLPTEVAWDGKDNAGLMAPVDQDYGFQLTLTGMDTSQVKLEQPILPVPALIDRPRDPLRIRLVNINFDFKSTEISAEAGARIAQAWQLTHVEGWTIRAIEGHADEVGSMEANLTISRERALAVRDYLQTLGFQETDKILVQGFGKNRPVIIEGKPQRGSLNRRVEILLEKTIASSASAAPR